MSNFAQSLGLIVYSYVCCLLTVVCCHKKSSKAYSLSSEASNALGIGAASFASGDGDGGGFWGRRRRLEAEVGGGDGFWRRRRMMEAETEAETEAE